MQCNHITRKERQCKNKSTQPFCHLHRKGKFVQDRPTQCPVCYNTLAQCKKPLPCGHWVHMSCVKRANTGTCPLCRHKIPGLKVVQSTDDAETIMYEIPVELPEMAVILYVLFVHICKSCISDAVILIYMISGLLNEYVPIDAIGNQEIAELLYLECVNVIEDNELMHNPNLLQYQ